MRRELHTRHQCILENIEGKMECERSLEADAMEGDEMRVPRARPNFPNFFPEKTSPLIKYYKLSREFKGCTFALENGEEVNKW